MQDKPSLLSYLTIVLPTASGVVIYSVAFILFALIHGVTHLQQTLQIPSSWHASTFFLTNINSVLVHFLGSGRVDVIVLSLFWAVVGLIVYLFLKALISFAGELGRDLSESKQYIHPHAHAEQSEIRVLLGRTAFRLVVAVILFFYTIWLIGFLLNWSIAGGTAQGQWLASHAVFQYAVLYVVDCIALHVLTILLRLFLLRDRL